MGEDWTFSILTLRVLTSFTGVSAITRTSVWCNAFAMDTSSTAHRFRTAQSLPSFTTDILLDFSTKKIIEKTPNVWRSFASLSLPLIGTAGIFRWTFFDVSSHLFRCVQTTWTQILELMMIRSIACKTPWKFSLHWNRFATCSEPFRIHSKYWMLIHLGRYHFLFQQCSLNKNWKICLVPQP